MNPLKKLPARHRDAIGSQFWSWNYAQLENRMVLNGDLGWVVVGDNTQFDDLGRISSQELTVDTVDDQVADFRTVDHYEYSPDGLTTSYHHEEDAGADGMIDSQYWNEQEFAADETGIMVGILTETGLDGDGIFDESQQMPLDGGIGINENGEGNGGWNVIADETQLDEAGRITLQDLTYDTDGDGVGDYRTVDHFEYGADGLTTANLHEEDLGADGVVDSRQWSEQEYAADGKLLVSLEAWDYEADGQRDYQTRNTWTYDEFGNPVSLLTESDLDGDGAFDESHEESFDVGNGGTDNGYHVETEDVFDDLGRLIRSTNTFFNDSDNTPDSVQISSWTYLENGLVNTTTNEIDQNADGLVDYVEFATNEYDDGGLIAIHYQVDENADGEIDSSYTVDARNVRNLGDNGGEVYMSAGEVIRYGSNEFAPANNPANENPGAELNLQAVGAAIASSNASLVSSLGSVGSTFNQRNSNELTSIRTASTQELRLAGSQTQRLQPIVATDRDDAFAALATDSYELAGGDSLHEPFEIIDGSES